MTQQDAMTAGGGHGEETQTQARMTPVKIKPNRIEAKVEQFSISTPRKTKNKSRKEDDETQIQAFEAGWKCAMKGVTEMRANIEEDTARQIADTAIRWKAPEEAQLEQKASAEQLQAQLEATMSKMKITEDMMSKEKEARLAAQKQARREKEARNKVVADAEDMKGRIEELEKLLKKTANQQNKMQQRMTISLPLAEANCAGARLTVKTMAKKRARQMKRKIMKAKMRRNRSRRSIDCAGS